MLAVGGNGMQVQLPLETLQEAANLYGRWQAGEGFKRYLRVRARLIAPVALLMVLTAVACTAGTVVWLADARAFLMLVALLVAPFILLGSVFVQAYVFFGWLENRALAEGLHHRLEPETKFQRWIRKQLSAELGKFPAIPWLVVAAFVFLPLLLTATVAPKIVALLVALHALAIVLYARLDR
jgi:hypothetical protein